MNEVTKVHLGRQSFTIAVDAHKILQAYLAAIKHQVGDKAKDVVDEVELRMAELLSERGITGDKVVLVEDIEFLKSQLGEPGDFKEEDETEKPATEDIETTGPKRLFRDVDNAMLAGVAAGLSAYSGVPVIIIRLVFILLTFSGGFGILIYLLLWLLIPPTKSSSDYLQMKGLAVNIDNLKEVVDRADFQGAAQRAGHIVGHTWNRLARIISRLIGIGLIMISLGLLAAAATGTSYLLVHGLELAGTIIFPVGAKEINLVVCGLVALVLAAIIFAITGRSMISCKWTFPSWIMAAIITGFVISSSIGVALGLAVAPSVNHRYSQLQHQETRQLPAFTNIKVQGGHPLINFESDPIANYSIDVHTIGNINTKAITTTVVGDTLMVDISHVPAQKTICASICPFGHENVELIVHEPQPFDFQP